MSRLLKQSTAFTFRIGPFLDSTDGVTAETGLSIAQADMQISKDGGAFAQTSDGSPTTTHDTDGWYQCPLTTTDTNTLGPFTIQIVMAGALPVWEHFMVVPANTYDSLVDGADYLQADAIQIEGSDATDQINAACDTALTDYDAVVPADLPTNFADLSITETTGRVDVAAVAGTAQTANDNGADINAILTDTNELQTDLTDGGRLDLLIDSILADTNELQGDWTNGGRLDLIVDDILADTNELQTDFTDGGRLDLLVDAILADTNELQGDWVNGGRLDLIVDAILSDTNAILVDTNELQTDWTNGGRLDLLIDAILADTGELQTDLTNGGRLDLLIDAILADTNELQTDDIPGTIAALNDIAAADVWDSTSATLSLAFETMLDRIYRLLMNKMNITDATGSVALRNEVDDGNIATQTITDDDTTTVRSAVSWA